MSAHTIVTGGSSGIGAAVVGLLRARGEAVTVLDLQAPGDGDIPYSPVDVVDELAVRSAIETAEAHRGVATGLVACHGIRGQFVPAADLDLAATRRVMDIHFLGTLIVCRELVRRLDGRAASIVAVSSTTAYGGWERQSDYGPAKAAIAQLTQNLAIEWAPLGVRVNSVAPGFTLTPLVQEMIDDDGYDTAPVEARTPLGRMASPDEIGVTIVHLLRDATYVTGQCVAVDGGSISNCRRSGWAR